MKFKVCIAERRMTYNYFWFAGEVDDYDIYVTITISEDLNTNSHIDIYNNKNDYCCKLRSIKEDLFMSHSDIYYDYKVDSKYKLVGIPCDKICLLNKFINLCMDKLAFYYGM